MDGPFGSGVPEWSDREIAQQLAPVLDAVALCGAPAWISMDGLDALRTARPDAELLLYASNTAGEPTLGPVVVDAPLTGLVAWGWTVARNRLRGALNWEVDFRPGCFRDPLCSGEGQNLDATLVYRAEELGGPEGELYASWRLKALRRGAQDAALLHLLAAREPESAVRFGELMIPHALGEGPEHGFGSWPRDLQTWRAVRSELRARVRGKAAPRVLSELRPSQFELWAAPYGWALFVLTLVLLLAWIGRRLALRSRI